MSPQRKGRITPADDERIRKAIEIRQWAELEVVAAVLDAMRHGASIRETAIASGLSERTIIRWRKGQGLPTQDDWHRDSRERRERLYEVYPGWRLVEQMLHDLKGEKPPE